MKYVGNKEDKEYKKRPGAYAIIVRNEDEKVGIVTDGIDFFYLGGGIEKEESKIEALERELIEESGYKLKNIQDFIEVGEYIFDKRRGYVEVIANLYIAEFDKKVTKPIENDHVVLWVEPKEYQAKLHREWQRYAMERFIEYRRNKNV